MILPLSSDEPASIQEPPSRRVETSIRLAYFVSHPIQYQVPLLRRIAKEPGIDLTVFFSSDFSTRSYHDPGFGVAVQWDVNLLDGYRYEFLPALLKSKVYSLFTPINYGFTARLATSDGSPLFDVLWVHGYATINQLHAIVVAKALSMPVLLRSDSSLHDRPRSRLKLHLKTIFFAALKSLVQGVLTTGTLNRQYWEHYLGPDVPLFLLPYAVDNEWFQEQLRQQASGRGALRAELGLDPHRPVVLFASKMQTRKHCDDLIRAYARLSPGPGLDPEPYLVLVGDGEERAALEQQVLASGLGSVRFCGFRNQSELPRFFDLASVFVLPARHEPWGLIVNEVMNAARPVILTDECGCHPDLITNGVEGFIYPARDVDALEHTLRTVLLTPQRSIEMGQNALKHINAWSFEQDVQGLKQALLQVTRKSPDCSLHEDER